MITTMAEIDQLYDITDEDYLQKLVKNEFRRCCFALSFEGYLQNQNNGCQLH